MRKQRISCVGNICWLRVEFLPDYGILGSHFIGNMMIQGNAQFWNKKCSEISSQSIQTKAIKEVAIQSHCKQICYQQLVRIWGFLNECYHAHLYTYLIDWVEKAYSNS